MITYDKQLYLLVTIPNKITYAYMASCIPIQFK